MKYGYARVSTRDKKQTLGSQHTALLDHGVELHNIHSDKASGKARNNRTGLSTVLSKLKKGDYLIVFKMDRVSRSIIDTINIINEIESKGAFIVELSGTGDKIDTSTAGGRMMISILATFAEFERGLISERVIAGLENAKSKGKKLGRPCTIPLGIKDQILFDIEQNGANKTQIAKKYGISRNSIYKLINSQKEKQVA